VDSLSNDMVLIVGATNCPENIDKALMRPGRFDRLVFVGPPDAESVLRLELERMGLASSIDVTSLAKECTYMSGADISGACRLAGVRALARGPEELPSDDDFREALRQSSRSCRPEVVERYQAFQKGSVQLQS